MKYLSITLFIVLWPLINFAASQQIIYPIPSDSKTPKAIIINHQLHKSILDKTQKDFTIPNPLLPDTVPLHRPKICLNALKKK